MQPRKPLHFDYVAIARVAGVNEDDLAAIERGTRPDCVHAGMLVELRNAAHAPRGLTVADVLAKLAENDAAA